VCRLFGMSTGTERAKATFWLIEAPDSLSVQSEREPDGTGLGWFDERAVAEVSKQPIAAFEDKRFASEAKQVASKTFIAHVRFASTGALETRNTHPFEQRGRIFAHNGVIGDLNALDDHLGGEAGRLVKGDTDSERFFALITREIEDAKGDVDRGIAAACRWVARQLPVFAINFVLITDGGLWALRYPETHPLYVLEREAGAELTHHSSLGMRVSSQHGLEKPMVVIASEKMDSDSAWRELRSGELVHVGETLEVTFERVLSKPPAKPLSLNDLSAHARASQTAHPAAATSTE
jgi:predicted glutamine amidotransferase